MRRLSLAVSLAVGGFLAAGGVAGLAQAMADDEPERLAIPEPQPGDEAMYATSQVRFDNRWAPLPYVLRDAQVAWTGPLRATGDDGVEHDAIELRIRSHYEWGEPHYESDVHGEVFYDRVTREVLHVVVHENFPEQRPSGMLNNEVSTGVTELHLGGSVPTSVWTRTLATREWLGPCGFWGAVHGDGVRLDETVALGGSCDNARPTGALFRYDGREKVAGIEAYRFQNVEDPQVRIWYAPGIPFPVKVRDHLSDLLEPLKTGGWVFEWTLSGIRQGAPVAPAGDARLPGPLPVQQAAPLVAGLPDASDVTHPFPITAALDAIALQDESFQSFLGRPGVYLGFTWQEALEDAEGRLTWTWSLLATDGHRWQAREAIREPIDPRLEALYSVVPAQVTVVPWELDLPADVAGIYPTIDQVPVTFPRVAEAYRAFDATNFRAGERPAERWAAIHRCADDCATVFHILHVGVLRLGADDGPLAPPPKVFQTLGYGSDGALLFQAERTENLTEQPLIPLVGSANPARAASNGAPLAWQPPSSAVVVTLGATSLALGALVYLWPALKSAMSGAGTGGAGLFSRIEDSRLLDHKGRAAIVQAIEAEPGVHLRELARRTGQAEGALRHHLRKLEAAGLVVARPLGGYLCYFAPAAASAAGAGASAAARSEGARKVLAAMQGGATGVREIAAATGLAPSTVSHHLGRLREAGAVPAGGESPDDYPA
ncbi:MAG: ArsR family transcriptional regulator [Thermoplasmatota archaeon]